MSRLRLKLTTIGTHIPFEWSWTHQKMRPGFAEEILRIPCRASIRRHRSGR